MAKKDRAQRIALISEWLESASDETLARVEKMQKRVSKNAQLSQEFDAKAGFDWDEFAAHAAANQWRTRMERGYKRYTDFFGFIQDVYGPWIEKAKSAGRPLVQADIAKVDDALYTRLLVMVSKKGLPDTLDLPASKDLALRGLNDEEKERLLERRRLTRESVQLYRLAKD
jgi:hypothetical protein